MVIRAKLKFNCEENVEHLLKAFFSKESFNEKNTISIKNDECELNVSFNGEPPSNLIEAISYCTIVAFSNKENNL